ncbi:MAG TPA: integrase family protein [Nitrospira sp.]|nr:integrase family protein [Nitrospira sp.]
MGRVKLTAGRIRDFICPSDAGQAFLWDTDAPGLAVRSTANGAKSYIFQGKLNGKTIRTTIGDVRSWDIETGDTRRPGAREEARRLQTLIDTGIDPRQAKADEIEAAETKRAEAAAVRKGDERKQIIVRAVWDAYVEARKTIPRKGKVWSPRHLADHQHLTNSGRAGKRREETTPGALAALMPLRLSDLTQARVQKWLEWESSLRPTQAALAYRLLRAFLNWCEGEPEYAGLAEANACTAEKTRDSLPKQKAKIDSLQREQLPAWFAAVRQIRNPVIFAYLQALLLTGARREELANLKWTDVDFKWNSLSIRDKIEGERVIPLTPYVALMLSELKRINDTPPKVKKIRGQEEPKQKWKPSEWVFSSKSAASGRLQEPSIQHRKACAVAGIDGLTLHGLRRSFKSLAEWVEIPTGVVAQVMGHKPSATAEKHYTVRPLDLLRIWHSRYEAWILEQGGVKFEATKPAQGLKVVK